MGYVCAVCGQGFPLSDRRFRCDCQGFLRLAVDRLFPRRSLKGRDWTIWRYREAFGLPPEVEAVSLGEGRTPVIRRVVQGAEAAFKLEYLQPSGSFKDRGASVLLSLVRHLRVQRVVEDSSGNAGAAVSAYAAAAGIRCTVFVPAYTPEGKLAQMRLYGSQVVKVAGKRQDANRAAVEAAREAFYASHLWHPLFVMGLQSAAFEIWEQYGGSAPPRVVVPVGSGGFLEGLHLGFTALRRAGYLKRVPVLIGVQAQRCPPIHQAFVEGLADFKEMEVEPTMAEGIAVQRPPRARDVLKALRESGGRTLSVSEQEILAAQGVLFSLGLFPEPTSASALAGWLKLPPEERGGALIMLTGHGLKETRKLEDLFLSSAKP